MLIWGFLGMAAVAGGVYAPLWMHTPLGPRPGTTSSSVLAVFARSRHAGSDGRVLGALLDARSLYARISERLNPASPPRELLLRGGISACGPGFMLWKEV